MVDLEICLVAIEDEVRIEFSHTSQNIADELIKHTNFFIFIFEKWFYVENIMCMYIVGLKLKSWFWLKNKFRLFFHTLVRFRSLIHTYKTKIYVGIVNFVVTRLQKQRLVASLFPATNKNW